MPTRPALIVCEMPERRCQFTTDGASFARLQEDDEKDDDQNQDEKSAAYVHALASSQSLVDRAEGDECK